MSDTEANLISQRFDLTANSSIIRVNLENLPTDINKVKKVIWTVETTTGETRSAILNVNGVSKPLFPGQPFYMNAYLAFDPTVMNIAAGGKVKVTVIGSDRSIEWSKTVAAGKNYVAGSRYTSTVSGWGTAQAAFRFTIDITDPTQPYEISQHSAPSTCPANLTINWGDGASQTINKYASLPDVAIASHTYAGAGTYTITIYSDQPDPSNVQMPQITFHDYGGEKNLTAILDPFPNMGATSFQSCLSGCTKLTSIPEDLFRYNTQVTIFTFCFSDCTGLTTLPEGLFRYNSEVTQFTASFMGCNGLTTIPEGLFKYNTQVTSFDTCFGDCVGLSSIPEDLFLYNTQATYFGECFCSCESLTSIPAGLFRKNTEVIYFDACFNRCLVLTSVPAGLFDNNKKVVHFNECFMYCTELTSIPADLFRYNTQATNFYHCFTRTKLSSIPADLFRYNTQATSFSYCFDECSELQSIPAGLFSYNQAATDFEFCFSSCTGLTSIPAGLFDNNLNATNFHGCFNNCTGLTGVTAVPVNLFRYNGEATTFSYCFYNCTELTTLPNDLFLYNTKVTDFSHCFSGCTKLKLRADIFPSPAPLFGKPDFFNDRAMNFTDFCKNVGSHPTAIAGTAPKLWSFNYGAGVTPTGCFTGANVTNAGDIPNNWK
ncbi:MAG: hypothetical protein ACOX19_08825 [Fermentimonas sp.]